MKILIGSQNPVKNDAVRQALSNYFDNIDVVGYEVDSGVSIQPIGDETFTGAKTER